MISYNISISVFANILNANDLESRVFTLKYMFDDTGLTISLTDYLR